MPLHREESFASISDQLAQLVAITIANNNRLDAIIAKLTETTTILTTTLIVSTNMGAIMSQPPPPSSPPSVTSISQSLLLATPTSPSITPPTPPPSPIQLKIKPLLPPSPKVPLQPITPPTPPPSPIQLKIKPLLRPSPKEPLPQPPSTTTYGHIRHLKIFFRQFDECFNTLFTLNIYLLDLEDEVNFKGGGIDTCLGLYPRPPPWPNWIDNMVHTSALLCN
ncbi:unnamed protein product [Lactuca virosa]|uniref:Uncharacterized protein n=1 Tax=Lactuca virosa TaxID=75947 RepID=A0AAU9MX74_9ASTR|nr:unnamed protein product [Lactuca virosa]